MHNALDDDGPPGEVCFHAQQAIEKALKALLASAGTEVPFTHNLPVLREIVPGPLRPDVDLVRLERLYELESQSRYPGDWLAPTDEEAAWASELADSVVQSVRQSLA